MRKLTFAVFAALATAVAAPASAETVQFELRIPHGDLDLTNPADLDQLRERVRTAVIEACTQDDLSYTDEPMVDQACVARTLSDANTKVEQSRPQDVAILDR